jgi:hypothetical protein
MQVNNFVLKINRFEMEKIFKELISKVYLTFINFNDLIIIFFKLWNWSTGIILINNFGAYLNG